MTAEYASSAVSSTVQTGSLPRLATKKLFAPGHLGELTALVPFELVDAILDETRNVQRRLRTLPTRVGVYFLLAMCLFPEVGYLLVWQKLTASLIALPVVTPTAKALRDLRRRVGSAPMQRLFEVLSGPLAQPRTPGARFGPYRTVSFDGCSSLKTPDTARNRAWLGSPGHGGYPLLELMTLVETGTRALIGAVFGATGEGETGYARRLLHLLKPDMLVLWDKGFDSNAFLAQVSATGAQFLGRLRSNRRTPILASLTDGSYLSMIGTLKIRIIEARDGNLRGRHHLHRHLPPSHHADRRTPLSGRRPGQPLPPAVGTRVGLLRAPPHDHAGADTALGR
uniref:transposase domain-containing protein n=1 Tax=Microtetraspora fusca TaxID=1997 RepID=UPI000B19601C